MAVTRGSYDFKAAKAANDTGAAAQQTADAKAKVYRTTDATVTGYAVGDMWVRTTTATDETTGETTSSTTTYVCVSAYGSAFDEADWAIASTDDTSATSAQTAVEALTQSTEDAIDGILGTLQGTEGVAGVLDTLATLGAELASLGDEYHTAWEGIDSFIKILEAAGQPQMILGSNTSDWNVVITGTQMVFRNGDNPVAYINAEGLHVTNYLSFGNFQFYQRTNGHFSLKFIGGGD